MYTLLMLVVMGYNYGSLQVINVPNLSYQQCELTAKQVAQGDNVTVQSSQCILQAEK